MFAGSIVWRGIVYSVLMAIGKLLCGLWLLRVPNPVEKLQVLVRIARGKLETGEKPTSATRASNASPTSARSSDPPKPISLYPGMILGSAMVARGEIGYLISSLAEGHGVFQQGSEGSKSGEPSDLFLIITWAITICTIAGPVTMGYLVDRVRKLEKAASGPNPQTGRANVLGVWGVS